MMYQQIKNLIESGVLLEQIVYVNFEDERLLEILMKPILGEQLVEIHSGNWIKL